MPKVNLAGVKTGFDAITEGPHPAMFVDFKNKTNKNGDLMIVAEFTVTDEDEEFAGQKAWVNYNIDDVGTRYFKMFLAALGADEDILEGEFDTDEILDDLKNSPVTMVCGQPREYNGALKTQVRYVTAPGY